MPIYQQWIDTYAGEAFGEVVRSVLALTNTEAEPLTEAERERMAEHFTMTSRLEYMIWVMWYRQQVWDV